ncbi:hypothetical protein AS159_05420 [Thermotoga sp. Ku-13t]|uniref:helix-turn-helix transcriptional regulator n=1 Tax=Thermotoga sp. Ku-13t TaxID=1755813 RepID=UPI0013EC9C60|nr:transcriptional regulator [Thermotoga sp. Ku-13t]KAF2957841.1 hypothetical protein AS159_05420 [Thermotoga sp. Ku-13t]
MKRRDVENKINRIYRIMSKLMKGTKVHTRQLAEELNVTVRTVERYIEEMKMAGIPVVNRRGVVELQKDFVVDHDYTLSLTARQKKILLLIVELAKKYFGSLYFDDLKEIELKIRDSLQLDSFFWKYATRIDYYYLLNPKSEFVDRNIIEALEEAMERRYVVSFTYRHPILGWRSYIVEPYRFVFTDEHWYLFCREASRNFELLLRVSRIHPPVQATGKIFSMPTTREIESKLSKVWGTHFSNNSYQIEVWFSKKVANKVRETIRHETQRVQELEDGSLIYSVNICGYREFISWVLSWGAEAKLLSPEWMRKKVIDEIDRMKAIYAQDDRH